MRVIYLNPVEPNFLRERFMKEKEEEIRALKREIFTERFNRSCEENPHTCELPQYGEMSLDMAKDITNSALACLNFLLQNAPVLLSGEDLRGYAVYKCDAAGNLVDQKRYITDANEDDWAVTYVVLFPDKTYEMCFAQHGEMFDQTSALFGCEEEAYLYCNFIEKRTDGSWKYDISFSIDIEKGTFLELFEAIYYNQDDYMRVLDEVDKIGEELAGKKVLKVCSDTE